jgi:hypothetical protein
LVDTENFLVSRETGLVLMLDSYNLPVSFIGMLMGAAAEFGKKGIAGPDSGEGMGGAAKRDEERERKRLPGMCEAKRTIQNGTRTKKNPKK